MTAIEKTVLRQSKMRLVPQHVSTLLQAITKMRATSTLLVSMVLRAASFTAMVSL